MADNGVRVSNREIYDAVQRLEKTLGEYIAATDVRLGHLEEPPQRGTRRWQFWAAVMASPAVGAMVGWFGFKGGAS